MRSRTNRGRVIWSGLMCLAVAMFIWMKLRVVSSVPRTAYAEPRHVQPPPTPGEPAAPR